jgi:predicted glycoside hydrolase/deacetylase ChbG (UPF0249 family)
MKEIEKEKLEQLKKAHPGGLLEGTVNFTDEDDIPHEVAFIYRRPTTADIEAHAKTSQKNPIVANLNLISSLIVYPEPGPVCEAMREFPAAYGRFVEEAISPFFGANVTVTKRKL